MVAAGIMTGVMGESVGSSGTETDAGSLISVTYPLMLMGTTAPTSSDTICRTDCGMSSTIAVTWLAGAVRTMVVVMSRGGATVTMVCNGSGCWTTAVVTMSPNVTMTVCAAMRLGASAQAKRVAEENKNILSGCGL